jgi:hypothetical protein
MAWERVHTVNDYYDGPRRGVAEFHGKPHVYESQFSDIADDYTDRFLLMEIDSELFKLALEDWTIWLRWHAAYQRGEASLDTHPARPVDRSRHEMLAQLVGNRLCAEPSRSAVMAAEFRNVVGGWDSFEVQWREVAT